MVLFTNYFSRETLQLEDAAEGDKDQLIVGWVKDKGDLIKKELIAGKAKMTGSVSASGSTTIPKPSQNVIGVIEGTDPGLKMNIYSFPRIMIMLEQEKKEGNYFGRFNL